MMMPKPIRSMKTVSQMSASGERFMTVFFKGGESYHSRIGVPVLRRPGR